MEQLPSLSKREHAANFAKLGFVQFVVVQKPYLEAEKLAKQRLVPNLLFLGKVILWQVNLIVSGCIVSFDWCQAGFRPDDSKDCISCFAE